MDRFLVKSLVSSFSHRCNFYITPKQVLEKLKSVVVVLSLWFIQAIEHGFCRDYSVLNPRLMLVEHEEMLVIGPFRQTHRFNMLP